MTNDCKTLNLSKEDLIKTVEIGYSSSGISQLSFISQAGDFKVTGTRGRADLNKAFTFNNDPYSFYGLVGTSQDQVDSMSIIRFDKECLDTQKAKQGSNF